MYTNRALRSTRRWLMLFIICLFLSGLTAIPIHKELELLENLFARTTWVLYWLNKVHSAYNEVTAQHPFLLYGYDWLAFAHFILAILFIGPYRDPVRNVWVIQFGLIACVLVIPFAFVAGEFREIPMGWRLIDCSFGVVGFVILKKTLKEVNSLQANAENYSPSFAITT